MIIEIKALGGRDVNRKVVTMVVESIDGKIYDPMTGEEITIVYGWTEIKGWGEIDGIAHDLSNGCTVPYKAWRAAEDATKNKEKAAAEFIAHMGGRFESDDE